MARSAANIPDVEVRTERRRYPVGWPLLILCLTVTLLSSVWLLYSGRNYQETLSLQIARQPQVTSVYQLVAPDNPAPLYYAGVYALARVFTPSMLLLRELSLICFFCMLPLAYLVATRATNDSRVGILSAALIGISPFMVWFASRATSYALLTVLVLVNAYFFAGILQRKQWSWIGYVISGLIGLGVHYFFIVVLVTQLLFGIMEFRKLAHATRIILPLAVVGFVVLLGYWQYVSSLYSPVWGQLPYTARPSATNVFIIFIQFLFGFQSVETITLLIALWPVLVILALLAVQKYVGPPLVVRYFVAAAFLPVVGFFVLGWLSKPLFLSSYLIICLPPFMMMVAWYLVSFELPALVWVRNILLLVMAGMLLLELANTDRALSGDYLGLLPGYRPGLISETYRYHPALVANVSAYDGHQAPAAGPPLQVPSDSPGVLIHR